MTDEELLGLDEPSFVENAYLAALGRAPDPKGMRSYLQRLSGGVPKLQVLAELRGSSEGKAFSARSASAPEAAKPRSVPAPATRARTGPRRGIDLQQLLNCDSPEFIDLAYRVTLLREADESGRRNCAWLLASGISRIEILRQLLESEEGRSRKVPLPEIREAIARQRYTRIPGVRQALRAWRIVSGRLGKARNNPPGRAASASVLPGLGPVRWQSKDHNASYRGTMNQDSKEMLSTQETGDRELRDSAAGSSSSTASRVTSSPSGGLTLERFVGPVAHGWSYLPDGGAGSVSVEFGQRVIGKIVPCVARPEMQAALGLDEPVGFAAVLGGVLQFAAMAPAFESVHLSQTAAGAQSLSVDLAAHFEQALTFSPLRALMRPLLGQQAGILRSIRMISPSEGTLVFEADAPVGENRTRIFIDLYQQQEGNSLTRIARFSVELAGQVTTLDFRMLDVTRPVLMVVTDESRALIATDCIPLPTLHSDLNTPLVEYHVVLEGGRPAFVMAAKLARRYFDSRLKPRLAETSEAIVGPSAENTCLLLYSRAQFDPDVGAALATHADLAASVAYLTHDGLLVTAGGGSIPIADFVSSTKAEYVLLADVETRLRPDFWSVIDDNRFRFSGKSAELVHWHSIWVDGAVRPQVVKTGLLLHPAFESHALLSIRCALVRSSLLAEAIAHAGDRMRSGQLVIESAFSFVEAAQVVTVPVVMDTVRVPIAPSVHRRYVTENVELPMSPRAGREPSFSGGLSIVLNYRDSVEDTVRCLESIRNQTFDGDIEIVLVNNGSTADSVGSITGRAIELFGIDGVRSINYSQRFNHSAQCNIAARAAKHDTLFMLSNDSLLRTPRAMARAAAIAQIPWIGSVGFRIVANAAGKGRLQSLGLAVNERPYLFSGGSPVATNIAPAFAHDKTFEVIGNTFAASIVRREVYVELDGLDAEAFPTNHNDIDFSFRATHKGYRHVAIGTEVVEHMGRGSREEDLALPIDQRIIERAPRLELLSRVGFQQL